jgi:hypothetical protein
MNLGHPRNCWMMNNEEGKQAMYKWLVVALIVLVPGNAAPGNSPLPTRDGRWDRHLMRFRRPHLLPDALICNLYPQTNKDKSRHWNNPLDWCTSGNVGNGVKLAIMKLAGNFYLWGVNRDYIIPAHSTT